MAQPQDRRDLDWDRIAAYFVAARGRRTQQEVADTIGVDVSTIQNLEGRRTPRRKPWTAEALAAFYGWRPGSLEKVGRGGEPELYEVPTVAPLRPLTRAERDARIAELLADTTLKNGDLRVRMQALWDWPITDDAPSD